MSFTLNIAERELEPYGRIVRTCDGNPLLGEVRHYLNAATGDGPATLYVCDDPLDAKAAHDAGCYAVYVGMEDDAPAEGASLSVLGGESVSIVFDALLDIARRFGGWERDMDMIRLTGGSLQDLVDVSEPFLGNNVVVLDPALKLIAYTKGVPCDDPITMELIEHGYHTDENIQKFKLNKRFKTWAEDDGFIVNDTRSICHYTTITKSFKDRSSFSIITVMMCNVSDDLEYLFDVFGMFTDRVEFYALRDYPNDKPSGSLVDSFVKDLISGSLDERAIAERSQFAGIPSQGQFCLYYTKPYTDSAPISRLLSDMALVVAPAKTICVDDAAMILCFNCSHSNHAVPHEPETCPSAHKSASERLNKVLDRHGLTCGRSSKFTSLTQMPTAFSQAREAFGVSQEAAVREVGMRKNIWSNIYSFDRYDMGYLAKQLSDEAKSLLESTYANRVLQSIAHQDELAHTNNYDFLRVYLVYERRASAVAEQLHMHRNNVGYRIGRIEEQFDIDTSDPQLRQDLLFAYRIREAR